MADLSTERVLLPESTLERFRLYQPLLRLWNYKNQESLTAAMIAEFLDIPLQLVKEDLQYCLNSPIKESDNIEVEILIDSIELLLGQKEYKEALLIGVGKLGTSLLRNIAIAGSGLKIVAAFDIDPLKIGKTLSGIKVQNIQKLHLFVRQMHLKMALIATTPENAVEACELAVSAGVHVVWNFTQTYIPPREGVIIQNTLSTLNIDDDYQQILARL